MIQSAPWALVKATCGKCIAEKIGRRSCPKTALFALRAVWCLCGQFFPFVSSHTADYTTLASVLFGFLFGFSCSTTRWQNPSDSRYLLAQSVEQNALVKLSNRTLRLLPHVSHASRLLDDIAVFLCSLDWCAVALFVQSGTRHRVDESFSLCVSVDQCRLPCLV